MSIPILATRGFNASIVLNKAVIIFNLAEPFHGDRRSDFQTSRAVYRVKFNSKLGIE